MALVKASYGYSLNQGGPGVNESVRETFHERELMPALLIADGPMVFQPDKHASGFSAMQTLAAHDNETYLGNEDKSGNLDWTDSIGFVQNITPAFVTMVDG